MVAGSVESAGQQQPSPPPQAQATIVTTATQEVLLDLVVRDKRGRLIRNLRQDELTIVDDGVRQNIRGFRSVDLGGGGGDALNAKAGVRELTASIRQELGDPRGLDGRRDPRLLTLVFDQLLPGQRPYAKTAALELLRANGSNAETLFAAFRVDQKLTQLEAFTPERAKLESAIERATDPTYSLNIDEESRIGKQQATAALAQTLAEMKLAGTTTGSYATTAQRVAQMTLNMLQFGEAGERTHQGRAQLLALWQLVEEQARMPGRKTVVYFTGGLQVPPEFQEGFRQIVSAANRANVTVYAVFVTGVATYLGNASGTALLAQSVASSRTNMLDRIGTVSPDQAQVFDRAADAVQANVQNPLEVLARETGGFAATGNDFRTAASRIAEEASFHYEAAYSPVIERYDGRFRKIAVAVSRPGATVQTRAGYYALPAPMVGQRDLQAFEVPLLAAIGATGGPLTNSLPFRAAAKWFGDRTGFVVDVPIAAVQLSEDRAAGAYRMHLSLAALFKDENGEVVQRVSRDIPMTGRIENMDATRAGHFIFTHHVDLPAGRYRMETAVLDRDGARIGVDRQMVVVPRGPGAGVLSMSEMMLVRGIGAETEAPDPTSPFVVGGRKVTPELGSVVSGGVVRLFFAVQGAGAGPGSRLGLTLEFAGGNGQLVAVSHPAMPEADGSGRVPCLVEVPVEALPAGAYDLRARVTAGAASAERRMSVEIVK